MVVSQVQVLVLVPLSVSNSAIFARSIIRPRQKHFRVFVCFLARLRWPTTTMTRRATWPPTSSSPSSLSSSSPSRSPPSHAQQKASMPIFLHARHTHRALERPEERIHGCQCKPCLDRRKQVLSASTFNPKLTKKSVFLCRAFTPFPDWFPERLFSPSDGHS